NDSRANFPDLTTCNLSYFQSNVPNSDAEHLILVALTLNPSPILGEGLRVRASPILGEACPEP
ncbi:hypothetical protein J0895_16100, partial [Phormidium pseudopriestleyi FRX01]